jgi:hypothetical protein
MTPSAVKFLEIIQHPIKFRLFLLKKLPSAFFSGVRIKYADESKAIVTVPYKWFSTNPFKSTYFACLSMAAEMSTGILAMAHIYEQTPQMSMLVVKTEGTYSKKATGITTFTCEDGLLIENAIREAMASGKGTSLSARSVGIDKNGDVVAEFIISWSFKAKPATVLP